MNIPLMKKLRNRFARMRHPKHFRMKQIAIRTDCGAAMCLIGHTLELGGYKRILRRSVDEMILMSDGARSDYDFVSPRGRKTTNPYQSARRLLRLNEFAADAMFHNFDLKTPRQAVKYLDKLIAEHKS